MGSDVSKFQRLKHSIDATVRMNADPMAGVELSNIYDKYRDDVLLSLPTDLHDEFKRLFPRLNQQELKKHDILAINQATATARTRLTALYGWLEGVIASEKSSG